MRMKVPGIVFLSLLLLSCSHNDLDEFAFRNTLEYELVDKCGDSDKECVAAVKSQTKPCMEKSDWRRYLAHKESKEELQRFTRSFYACIVDKNGNPYFRSKT